jgi:hypothetical protein
MCGGLIDPAAWAELSKYQKNKMKWHGKKYDVFISTWEKEVEPVKMQAAPPVNFDSDEPPTIVETELSITY